MSRTKTEQPSGPGGRGTIGWKTSLAARMVVAVGVLLLFAAINLLSNLRTLRVVAQEFHMMDLTERRRAAAFRVSLDVDRLLQTEPEDRADRAALVRTALDDMERELAVLRDGDPAQGRPPARGTLASGLTDIADAWRSRVRPAAEQALTASSPAEEATLVEALDDAILAFVRRISDVLERTSRSDEKWLQDLELRELGFLVLVAAFVAFFVALMPRLRQREAQALRSFEQAHTIRVILDSTADAIITIDEQGVVETCNHATESMFGYTCEEIVGQNVTMLMPPPYRDEHDGYLERYRSTGRPRVLGREREVQGLRQDGTVFPVALRVGKIQVSGRTCYMGTVQDITDRRAMEDRLRSSERKYRALVEHAPLGIYQSTPEGRFVAVNPALVEMLGYESPEEVLELDLRRDVYEDKGERSRHIDSTSGARGLNTVSTAWRRRDGTLIDVRLSVRPLHGANDRLELFEGIVEDVTESILAGERLRQAQKMEAVGQLTGGIAHDFNNLLTVVLTNIQLLAMEMTSQGRDLPVELTEIERAARRGAEMITRLLGFSRQQPISLSPLNLADSVTSSMKMVRQLIPSSIQIRHVIGAPKVTVLADPGALEQMLLNLATNARDAMKGTGTIVVDVSQRAPADPPDPPDARTGPRSFACLAFSDDGEGMDEATLARVFDPFFTTKEPGAGTGLGMAMIYGLMQQHGGTAEVKSQRGLGTTVRLYFPVIDQAAPGTEPRQDSQEVAGGTETVLLVEDEPAVQRSALRLLERYGYSVVVAGNGEEALEIMEKRASEIDLVVTDVVMPRMRGGELAAAIRERGLSVRIVFCSGYEEREITDATAMVGSGDAFLKKPWSANEFLSTIRRTLDA